MPLNLPDVWGVKKDWKKKIPEHGDKVRVVGMKSLLLYNDALSQEAIQSTKGMIGILSRSSVTSNRFPSDVLWRVDFPELKDFWIYFFEDLEAV